MSEAFKLILGLEKVGFHGFLERRHELKAMRLCLWDESAPSRAHITVKP